MKKILLEIAIKRAVSMSDTGKQQFTADQSIYQPSDRYRSVRDDIDL